MLAAGNISFPMLAFQKNVLVFYIFIEVLYIPESREYLLKTGTCLVTLIASNANRE